MYICSKFTLNANGYRNNKRIENFVFNLGGWGAFGDDLWFDLCLMTLNGSVCSILVFWELKIGITT